MHSTTALSGGLRYSPTTSVSFCSKRGSLDSLKVLTRCGFNPRDDQIRWTVAFDTPARSAIVRQLQCVAPGGFSCSVNRTISSTFSAGIDGLRPRPLATWPNRLSPSAANCDRQLTTLDGDTANCAAIFVLAAPRPASSNALARVTSRWGAVRDLAIVSRISR